MNVSKARQKLHKKENKTIRNLIAAGLIPPSNATGGELIRFAYEQIGKKPPQKTHFSMPSQHAHFDIINRTIRGRAKGEKIEKKGDIERRIAAFYRSYEWRKLRYMALKENDGRCQCCGFSRNDGVRLHVDHIQPLRKFWELRLTLSNLQVLCELCNHGKGNWDQTDWRDPNLAALMGERLTGLN